MVVLSLEMLAISISCRISCSFFSSLTLLFLYRCHCKTLAWVPSPQEAQGLRVDWSLDFTTGSKNGDCSRSFPFPLRPLWIKDSWFLCNNQASHTAKRKHSKAVHCFICRCCASSHFPALFGVLKGCPGGEEWNDWQPLNLHQSLKQYRLLQLHCGGEESGKICTV